MVETEFYWKGADGRQDVLIGSIRYTFADDGGEGKRRIRLEGPYPQELHAISQVTLLISPDGPGTQEFPVALATLPAYWLRHIPAALSNLDQRAQVVRDDHTDADNLDSLFGSDEDEFDDLGDEDDLTGLLDTEGAQQA